MREQRCSWVIELAPTADLSTPPHKSPVCLRASQRPGLGVGAQMIDEGWAVGCLDPNPNLSKEVEMQGRFQGGRLLGLKTPRPSPVIVLRAP